MYASENKYQCEAILNLNNSSLKWVAYRVMPSANDEYIVARGNGVVMPGHNVKIPVVLLSVPKPPSVEDAGLPHKSILYIDLLDVAADYSDKNAKNVWNANVKDIVHCSVECIAHRLKRMAAEDVIIKPEILQFFGK